MCMSEKYKKKNVLNYFFMKITYEHEMATPYNSKHMNNQEGCTHG